MRIVREGFEEIGIRALLPPDKTSCVLNSFQLPENVTYDQLHDYLKANGFVIYAGQGRLVKEIFRISCMGEIDKRQLEKLIRVVSELLG